MRTWASYLVSNAVAIPQRLHRRFRAFPHAAISQNRARSLYRQLRPRPRHSCGGFAVVAGDTRDTERLYLDALCALGPSTSQQCSDGRRYVRNSPSCTGSRNRETVVSCPSRARSTCVALLPALHVNRSRRATRFLGSYERKHYRADGATQSLV
ncbi:hypothetical protein EXIGLDRAFT_198161 [Exidia glandulosa HHB12029]|uniref:Uncharacterized protein n=1 Tax=Exidia glandulosa HHB12029 TaxID=1314781 RepID=A0A166BCA5_EXIGL|nr:hypothetical protein EXIGLDRAFT_198161 [Exidia glandulosa HHB12029]